MTRVGRPTQTTPAMWADAALREIDEVGVRALSVQSVARRLGVTKGGFYHHFEGRDDLLRSALELWEAKFVIEFGAQAETQVDPAQRLRAILTRAVVELRPTVIVQLMAARDIPDVAATLARAAELRTAMLRRIFSELGFDDKAAQRRAMLTYSAFLGLAQLRHQLPDDLSLESQLRGYVEEFGVAITSASPTRQAADR